MHFAFDEDGDPGPEGVAPGGRGARSPGAALQGEPQDAGYRPGEQATTSRDYQASAGGFHCTLFSQRGCACVVCAFVICAFCPVRVVCACVLCVCVCVCVCVCPLCVCVCEHPCLILVAAPEGHSLRVGDTSMDTSGGAETQRRAGTTCFRSEAHVETLLRTLNAQRRDDVEHCDMTLRTRDADFPVHACIVSAGQ